MESTEKDQDKDVISIDDIDVVNIDDVEIPEETESSPATLQQVSDTNKPTSKIISVIFDIIAAIKGRDYWKLDEKEEKTVGKICPHILPKEISEHAGKIACFITLINMVVKRLKIDHAINEQLAQQMNEQVNEQVDTSKPLMGGRNG